MAIKMETATAEVTQQVFETIGLPVERSGNLLTYNGVPVTIAEACNGLRMVFALVLVSYAFAFTNPLRGSVRLLIVLLSPVSAILCNVIRLVPTVWLFGIWPLCGCGGRSPHDRGVGDVGRGVPDVDEHYSRPALGPDPGAALYPGV